MPQNHHGTSFGLPGDIQEARERPDAMPGSGPEAIALLAHHAYILRTERATPFRWEYVIFGGG